MLRPSTRVTAEANGFWVWLVTPDEVMLLTQHLRQAAAHACALTIAIKGGCFKAPLCSKCRGKFADEPPLN